jgi:hypothetical protein
LFFSDKEISLFESGTDSCDVHGCLVLLIIRELDKNKAKNKALLNFEDAFELTV